VVFRLCSLWFQNLEKDKSVTEAIKKELPKIPSREFLSLIYQLAARLSHSTENPEFQTVLKTLILNMARDHPFHSLYQIFALKNQENEPGM